MILELAVDFIPNLGHRLIYKASIVKKSNELIILANSYITNYFHIPVLAYCKILYCSAEPNLAFPNPIFINASNLYVLYVYWLLFSRSNRNLLVPIQSLLRIGLSKLPVRFSRNDIYLIFFVSFLHSFKILIYKIFLHCT